MIQSDMDEIPFIDIEESKKPNRLIIWLDQHIGKPDECILLKASIFMAMDPITLSYERVLNKDDINHSIVNKKPIMVRLDRVDFMLQPVVDVEQCFLAIEENRKKRIFFITSGSKGRIIVPSLVANFEDTFGPNNRIYIFCSNTLMRPVEGVVSPSNTWTLDFLEHILMFNHQDDLMARLVLEIATYFFTEAEHLEESNELINAVKFYKCSELLLQRYNKMDKSNVMASKINEIIQRISNIEQQPAENDSMETDHMSQPCA